MFDDVFLQDPVNRQDERNRGLASWWLGLPPLADGRRLWDLHGTNHGTLGTGITWSENTHEGGHKSTVGVATAYTDCGRLTALDGATYCHLSAWMYRPATGTVASLGRMSDTTNRFGIVWFNTGSVFFVADSGSGALQASVAHNVTGWYFFEIVFDASLAAGSRIAGFINGASVATGTGPASLPSINQPFAINRVNNSTSNCTGSYDDVRVSTAQRMGTLYAESRLGHPHLLNRYSRRVYSFGVEAAPPATGAGNLLLMGVG